MMVLALLPQPLQEERGGIPVRDETSRALIGSNRGPRLGAELSVRFPNRKAMEAQQRLKLFALARCQGPVVPRPGLDERGATAQPIGQVSDREGVSCRVVVAQDRAEVRKQ